MMKGWQLKTIGEVCEIINGGTPKTGVARYWGGDHLWITPAEMGKRSSPYVFETERKLTDLGLDDSSARMLPPFSVILSSRAPIGHLVINTEPMATNQGCKGLVPSVSIDHKFLFYYLGSIVGLLNELGTGATFKEISGSKLKEVHLPAPPLTEQKRIATILDAAFDGIGAAVANAQKNLVNVRELFGSYLQAAFANPSATVPISDLASDITDGDHSPPPKAESGIPFITISNIVKATGKIDFSDTFSVPDEYFRNLKPNKRPRRGDVLYTVTGATLGIPVLVREDRDFCFQRHIGLIRPTDQTDSSWLTYALLSPQSFRQATDGSTGAAQKTVSLKVLRGLRVPKLKLTEQKRIARRLDELSAETQKLESIYRRKRVALDQLKESILQKAFAGELTDRPQVRQEAAE
jgi:type I restriction enzyme S subunit